jgi:hypothetical protein
MRRRIEHEAAQIPFGCVRGFAAGGHVTRGVNLSQNHRFEFPCDVASSCGLDPIEDAASLGRATA